MTIIFDFNRTLYNPETAALMPGALQLLEALRATGHTLYLVSKKEAGREAKPETLGINSFFTQMYFVEEKGEALKKIISASPTPVFVVGDYLYEEVRIGNKLGAKTIWFKAGRFANLLPEEADDEPWRSVTSLEEVLPLIR